MEEKNINELRDSRIKTRIRQQKKFIEKEKEAIKEHQEAKRNFSRVDNIDLYIASDNITEGSIILEGGAFRGLYTAGVLDCLMDNNINLRKCVGISAGSLTGTNYISGNRGRSALGILKNRFNSRYVGARAFAESGSIVGFKFMFEDFNEIQELNEDRLFNSGKQIWVGCTDCNTGQMKYFDNSVGKEKFFKALKASASMPLLSRMVEIDDSKYLDGGCNTKIPLDFALENNFEKPIVVTTRPIFYRRKEVSTEYKLEEARYRKYPELLKALKNSSIKYNEDVSKIEELSRAGEIYVIQPSQPVKISRLENDMEKLGELYELGYKDCASQIINIKKYLGIDLSQTEQRKLSRKEKISSAIHKLISIFKN